MSPKNIILTFLLVNLFIASSSFAVNLQHFKRSNSLTYEILEDGRIDTGLGFSRYNWLGLIGFSFVDSPLVVKNIENSEQLDVVVDDMFGIHFGGSYYIKRWLQVSANGAFSSYSSLGGGGSGFNDLDLKVKFRVYDTDSYAVSLIPTFTLGLGGSDSLIQDQSGFRYGRHNVLSDESFGVALRAVFEQWYDYFQLTVNLGYRSANNARFIDNNGVTHIDISSAIFTGVGTYIPFGDRSGVNIEYARLWSLPFSNDINPNELYGGINFPVGDHIVLFGGIGLGNVFSGTDGNDFRLSAGVKFTDSNRRGNVYSNYVVEERNFIPSSEEEIASRDKKDREAWALRNLEIETRKCSFNYFFGDRNHLEYRLSDLESGNFERDLQVHFGSLFESRVGELEKIYIRVVNQPQDSKNIALI